MRYFITGQRSDVVSLCNTERAASELEVLITVSFLSYVKRDKLKNVFAPAQTNFIYSCVEMLKDKC